MKLLVLFAACSTAFQMSDQVPLANTCTPIGSKLSLPLMRATKMLTRRQIPVHKPVNAVVAFAYQILGRLTGINALWGWGMIVVFKTVNATYPVD